MTVSYYQRLARIKSEDDLCREMERTKKLSKEYKRRAKSAQRLDEKLEWHERWKENERVLRMLRLHVFDIEDFVTQETPTHIEIETGLPVVRTEIHYAHNPDAGYVYIRPDLNRISLTDSEVKPIT